MENKKRAEKSEKYENIAHRWPHVIFVIEDIRD